MIAFQLLAAAALAGFDTRVDAGAMTYAGFDCRAIAPHNLSCAAAGASPVDWYTFNPDGFRLYLYAGNLGALVFENCQGDDDYAQCDAPDVIFYSGFD